MKKTRSVILKTGMILGTTLLVPLISVQADSYDWYVDVENTTGTEAGTEGSPYNTIGEALAGAVEGDRLLIKNGTYSESIEIPRGVKVYGESKSGVIIEGEGSGSTVKMGHKTKLKKVTVKGGNTGIKVEAKAGVILEKVKVEEADQDGISLEGDSQTRKKDKYERIIEDCTIEDNGDKGMYIKKSQVTIRDSKINDNKEEGIDIRKGVKAEIESNEITGNGENNIEFKVDKASLEIIKNKIEDSERSGISAQAYQGEAGEIFIEDNNIENNDYYGLRCSVQKYPPSGGWSKVLFLSGNNYEGNKKDNFSSVCKF